eukprot:gnl/Trimastix_PCT/116.p3 GENE.gnl/Trimastix_PCT/116~~gnl/Trimastix_PCT/116.p3  ORF type:complete len:111 (+),score=22.97 gnl/Trimastix_PCT/116:513-845(+)
MLGDEDPRIVRVADTYYMFYTAVRNVSSGRPTDLGRARAQLALATTQTPLDPQSWVKHGPILPDSIFWCKSGALLPRTGKPHLLFWGDHHPAHTPHWHHAAARAHNHPLD